ncbi:MAG: hypothetical protein QXH27_00250 [Candidatus Micrarchaeia archaeon]
MRGEAKQKVNRKFENFVGKINQVFDRLFPPSLQPAHAFAKCLPLVEVESRPLTSVLKFSTGPLPDGLSRKIAKWQEIPPYNIFAAQREVAKLRHADGACHEYIAFHAAKLSGKPEAIEHTWQIMVGALAEDYIFRPGEKLEDLFVKAPSEPFKSGREFAQRYLNQKIGPLQGIFMGIAKLWKKMVGEAIEADPINRPYMGHFYDPMRAEGDRGLNIQNGEIRFQSALDRIKIFWHWGMELYANGEKSEAFCVLGHILHLIADLHVPAHVHNDVHGPTVFFGKLDSLEQWLKKRDYPDIRRGRGKMNITIWDSGPLEPPKENPSWTWENAMEKLADFVDNMARETQEFRSVDVPGTDPYQNKIGKLSDEECFKQANVLVPRAIQNSAIIIARFIECAWEYRISKLIKGHCPSLSSNT